MGDARQIEDQSELKQDAHSILVDIGRALQAEEPDVKAALALIRPALRELLSERDGYIATIERQKMMRADTGGILPIMPRTPAEAWEYARSMCQVGHVPQAYRVGGKKEGEPVLGLVALGIMKAMEIGVPPQTGLGNLMPVNDRFSVWGDLAQGLVQRQNVIATHGKELLNPSGFDISGNVSIEWPGDIGYRVWFTRRGEDGLHEHTYTVADAKRAKLWMHQYKKPWLEAPIRMLFNRARAFALRDGFSDCLFGLAIREEIDDYTDGEEVKKLPSTAFLDDPEDAPAEAA
jgi:hypothetical protein